MRNRDISARGQSFRDAIERIDLFFAKDERTPFTTSMIFILESFMKRSILLTALAFAVVAGTIATDDAGDGYGN